jgi:hypothetical protein
LEAIFVFNINNGTTRKRKGSLMSSHSGRLHGAFDITPDTSTIKGIIQCLRLWLEHGDKVPSELLERGCLEMSPRLESARLVTEKDLEGTGAATEAELEDSVLRSIEAYQHLKEITLEIAEAVRDGNREAGEELLRELEEAAQYLKEAQEDLQSWVEQPVARCPRCGAPESDPCAKCGLELLFPDPEGGAGVPAGTAQLPPEFGVLYQTYTAVRNGETSLATIWGTLPAVEKSTNSYLAVINASLMEKPASSTLLQARETLALLAEGIAVLRSTHSTRRMTDLQNGWQTIFQNAVKLEELRLQLLEELGGEAGQARAQKERLASSQRDTFSFSREE